CSAIRAGRGCYGEAGCRCCPSNVAMHYWQRPQWHAFSVLSDLTEETVFDGVPLRATRWVVADGHCQPKWIAELLLPDRRVSAKALPFPNVHPHREAHALE